MHFKELMLNNFHWIPKARLQLKRGLFWYRHHPEMHEMVSDRSSRAETWSDLRKNSMRIFSIRTNEENDNMVEKEKKCCVFVKQIFEKLHGPYQSWKKQKKHI